MSASGLRKNRLAPIRRSAWRQPNLAQPLSSPMLVGDSVRQREHAHVVPRAAVCAAS
jgi:hypothetical protein